MLPFWNRHFFFLAKKSDRFVPLFSIKCSFWNPNFLLIYCLWTAGCETLDVVVAVVDDDVAVVVDDVAVISTVVIAEGI